MERSLDGISLGICLPLTNDMVHSQFMDSFILMDKPVDWTYHRLQFPASGTSDISAVRNGIVRSALEQGNTHILMMDTDQTYPRDTLVKLLSHVPQGRQIITAKVHRRYQPFEPILLRGNGPDEYASVPPDVWRKGDTIEIDACGGACILIDVNVFLDMAPPWYEFGTSPKGNPIGEDINFCYKARRAGFRIWADTSIQVGHLALMEIGTGFYDVTQLIDRMRKT